MVLTRPALNLFSPEARRDPYPFYAALREDAPVHFFEELGVWTVSRYADVMAVFKRPDLFSSVGAASFESTLLGADPPGHTRIRKIVQPFFTGRRIAALEEQIQRDTDRLVEEAVQAGKLELVSGLSAPVPLLVIAAMLGVDPARCDDLKRWTTAMVLGASGALSPSEEAAAERDVAECNRFFEQLVERCQSGEVSSILTDFLQAEDAVSPQEAVELGKLLLVAGNETTTNLIGNAMIALLRNPEVLQAVRENLDLIPALVEETVRYDPPAQMVQRRTTQDVEVGGTQIPANSRVMVLIGSANRDEAEFTDPDQLALDRNAQPHVAFGFGTHYCLGSHIARLEARIVLTELLTRLPDLRAGEPLDTVEWIPSLHVRGPERLQLAFGPETVTETRPAEAKRSSGFFSRLFKKLV